VPAGEHMVTFRFVPRVVWMGMAVSLLAWTGWGLALVLRRGA